MTKPACQTPQKPACGISARAGLLFALLAAAIPAEGGALGRLFFTPEERAALDRQRQLGVEESQPAEAAALSINGIVRPSGGNATVWINGTPQDSSNITAGESSDGTTGWIKNGLNSGSIVINRKIPER